MSTPTPRQLPGVKGQWIKASDCPPTAADADRDGDIRVYLDNYEWGAYYKKLEFINPDDYWCPADFVDTRPFTLKPATTQPATTERRIVQLACHPKGTAIYAVADDGTAWVSSQERPDWNQMAALPPRDA